MFIDEVRKEYFLSYVLNVRELCEAIPDVRKECLCKVDRNLISFQRREIHWSRGLDLSAIYIEELLVWIHTKASKGSKLFTDTVVYDVLMPH